LRYLLGSGSTQRPDRQRAALLYSASRTRGLRSWTRHRTGWSPLRWLGMGFEIL